jgi:hypothetical protein
MENLILADLIVGRFVDQATQAIPIAAPSGLRDEVIASTDARSCHRSQSGRVVLFLPGPVTEDDLLTDNIRRSRSIRRHKFRRRRIRWLEENFGTVVFVTGLFVLAWFIAAK